MNADTPETLPSHHLEHIESVVGASPIRCLELDGGQVGTVYRVDFEDRPPVAAKTGTTPLRIEGKMLRYLDRQSPLPVPAVHDAGSDLLVMAFVDGDGRLDDSAQRHAAELLAALHGISADAFGFPFETVSGPYRQSNSWRDSWIEFFREQRLRAFARRAHEEGRLPRSYYDRVERLADRLEELLVEPATPSLVHNDFHDANLILDDGRVAAVLDPAIYFGHDELELAYVDYVGTFGEAFFDRYRELRDVPEAFFTHRSHVYRAFHVLENVRFFGTELLEDLDAALDRVGV